MGPPFVERLIVLCLGESFIRGSTVHPKQCLKMDYEYQCSISLSNYVETSSKYWMIIINMFLPKMVLGSNSLLRMLNREYTSTTCFSYYNLYGPTGLLLRLMHGFPATLNTIIQNLQIVTNGSNGSKQHLYTRNTMHCSLSRSLYFWGHSKHCSENSMGHVPAYTSHVVTHSSMYSHTAKHHIKNGAKGLSPYSKGLAEAAKQR